VIADGPGAAEPTRRRPSARARRPRRACYAGLGLAVAASLALVPVAAAAGTFRVDPRRSHLAVRLYRDGPASALAHDHVVEATEVTGRVEYDPAAPETAAIVVEVPTAALRVDEPAARRRLGLEGDLSEGQRADVDRSMRGPDQLDAARFPTVRFASTRVVAEGNGRLRVTGALTIRGVAREVTFPATVVAESGALRARASLPFLQSSFGYRPYRAFLGAVRNKDEATLHVDLVAVP
jgi:polyisoprenoid-binding protein YceI